MGDVIWKDFIDVFVEIVCVLGEGRMRAQVTQSSDTKTELSLINWGQGAGQDIPLNRDRHTLVTSTRTYRSFVGEYGIRGFDGEFVKTFSKSFLFC